MTPPPRRLLLHGFSGCGADWSVLGSKAGDLAPDLPGHGHWRGPVRGFADTLAQLLDSLPPRLDELIGYSFGGRLALALLQAAPERFASVTILSAHPGLRTSEARAERRAADRRWIRLLREEGIAAFVAAWEAQPLFASQRRLSPRVLERQRARRLAQNPEGLAAALEQLGLAEMPDTWPALATYAGRLRWIVGDEDAKFCAIADEVAALRPDTELHRLPGIGHNPLLEAPERLAALLGR
ncbi:MAG: alpha/beta fold hydrolase [Chromatiaceae bacterium]|nr:alpha/beta fold hydrolase [Chromatiaceae bacterium]